MLLSLSSVHLLDGSLCDCIWITTHKCNNQTFSNNSVSRSVSPFHSSHRPYLNKARRKEAYHELMSNVAFIDPTSSFILSEPKRLPCIPSHFNTVISNERHIRLLPSQAISTDRLQRRSHCSYILYIWCRSEIFCFRKLRIPQHKYDVAGRLRE